VKETLKLGLSSLPAPKNDFEIVVPEADDEADEEAGAVGKAAWIDDQVIQADYLLDIDFTKNIYTHQ
jgi:hypothetical protein